MTNNIIKKIFISRINSLRQGEWEVILFTKNKTKLNGIVVGYFVNLNKNEGEISIMMQSKKKLVINFNDILDVK